MLHLYTLIIIQYSKDGAFFFPRVFDELFEVVTASSLLRSTASRAQDLQLMGNCKCGFSTPRWQRYLRQRDRKRWDQ